MHDVLVKKAIVEEYRRRAQDARQESERTTSPSIKEGFLKVAQEYERMAEALRNAS